MNTLKQLKRLQKAHGLIKQQKTGTPAEFARKLYISERQLYNMLDKLKDFDAPINFNRNTKTYYYEHKFELLINVSVQVLVMDELRNVYGGYTFFNKNFDTARLMQWVKLY
ncbi:MAG: hypothetical protein KDC47_07805 [Flavobacteriaceae bacterium]|nr:hypothetical protein [Flavobacteriaceae bacterium]